MKRVTIVVPAYNEAENIQRLYTLITHVFVQRHCEFELLFINDGSGDDTQSVLEILASKDARVKYLMLARNSGQQAATAAGLAYASGDAVMIMDADLQHPPSYIPLFIEAWERGGEAIFGVRKARAGESQLRRFFSRTFWRIMNLLIGINLPPDASDFCLLDKKVVEKFRQLPHCNLMTRTRIAMIRARREYISFDVAERQHGESRYSLIKLVTLCIRNIVARYTPCSTAPRYAVHHTNYI